MDATTCGGSIGMAGASALPTNDLAYMMAIHWYPERRRRLERGLLDHYHAVLMENGVRGYSRTDMWEDYRLSVLWHTTTPVFQASLKLPAVIRWTTFNASWLRWMI